MNDFNDEDLEQQTEWIKDGHSVEITWDRDHVWVSNVNCPNVGRTALCNRTRSYCVVQKFIEVYGAECNVGRTTVSGPVEVVWAPILGDSDLDPEFAQVWVCPTDDPDYVALNALDPDEPN